MLVNKVFNKDELNVNALLKYFGISQFKAECFLRDLIWSIKSFSRYVPTIEIEWPLSEQGKEIQVCKKISISFPLA